MATPKSATPGRDSASAYVELVRSLAEHTDELEAIGDRIERLQEQGAWEDLRAALAEYTAKNVAFQRIDDAIRLCDAPSVIIR
jgi:alkylation response protein AidB-like acyl-CoA dehydrogenase